MCEVARFCEKSSREEIPIPNGTFTSRDDDSKKPYPDVASISEMWNLKTISVIDFISVDVYSYIDERLWRRNKFHLTVESSANAFEVSEKNPLEAEQKAEAIYTRKKF